MNYKVTHIHADNQKPDEVAAYQIEAGTPLQAAKIAHAKFHGIDLQDKEAVERYTWMVKENTYYYRAFISDRMPEERNKRVYTYDNISGHAIWVEWEV